MQRSTSRRKPQDASYIIISVAHRCLLGLQAAELYEGAVVSTTVHFVHKRLAFPIVGILLQSAACLLFIDHVLPMCASWQFVLLLFRCVEESAVCTLNHCHVNTAVST
jgi:hypothetical protein|mmetsp:Transcript_22400/g.38117  ORF Transcript_22400/g.38117 Transcript_22400/m.38117 type:complete len:108 (+) Transcript_22400:220-543(+)